MHPAALALHVLLALGRGTDDVDAPCPEYIPERLTLGPPVVHEGERVVETPPELAAYDQVVNDASQGREAVLRNTATERGVRFVLTVAYARTQAVDAYLSASSATPRRISCGYSVPVSPVLPGRYAQIGPSQPGSVLLVSPGRERVELRVRAGARELRAVYPVVCARLAGDADTAPCAPSEPVGELDGLPTFQVASPPTRSPWRAKERQLKIQTGISWSAVGLGVLSMVPSFVLIADCRLHGCFELYFPIYALPVSGIVTLASLIPASIYTARLHRHRQRRPVARLQPGPGGLVLRF
ncbi:MAG: hypothetical protein R3B09_29395 [Nannocystaceae bacterium]